MRGEHFLSSISQGGEAGSSPHARGAHQVGIWACVELGLIPACAGSTPQRGDRVQIWVAHPRMRGEHMNVFWFTYPVEGSSPHARGALPEVGEVPDLERLIPACAGSTSPSRQVRACERAHPRMRGEHTSSCRTPQRQSGSSPHARGAPGADRLHTGTRGLIPACAGSTGKGQRRLACTRAHPRMRGEHAASSALSSTCWGSSPHARGALHRRCVAGVDAGLIPACAGSTPSLLECGPGGGAHPRMRGEHDHPCGVVPRVRGSSPHARGARARHLLVERIKGLIPACAGSTAPAHD